MPPVFVLHGRNNKISGFVNYFPVDGGRPEAVVVYMQGLVMPWPKGKTADGKKKSGTGWQVEAGGQQDRNPICPCINNSTFVLAERLEQSLDVLGVSLDLLEGSEQGPA